MPIYEFSCDKCGTRFERVLRSSDGEARCPDCGAAEVTRRVSGVAAVGAEKNGCHTGGG